MPVIVGEFGKTLGLGKFGRQRCIPGEESRTTSPAQAKNWFVCGPFPRLCRGRLSPNWDAPLYPAAQRYCWLRLFGPAVHPLIFTCENNAIGLCFCALELLCRRVLIRHN